MILLTNFKNLNIILMLLDMNLYEMNQILLNQNKDMDPSFKIKIILFMIIILKLFKIK